MGSLSDIYSKLPDSMDDLPAPPNAQAVAEADYRARHWMSPEQGPLRPGSDPHKPALSAMFPDSFHPSTPPGIYWPTLDPATPT